MSDSGQQFRLRQFWGAAIFSLGILWGCANLAYFPIAALTSIVGSSWFEVFLIAAGGALTFCASIGAFYRRRLSSRLLLAGGIVLLVLAFFGQTSTHDSSHGIMNLLLLYLAGAVAIALGLFGAITDSKGWPPLRGSELGAKPAGRSR